MLEPGLDLHEWESEWRALEDQIENSPREALPELDDLVGRMLEARAGTRSTTRSRRKATSPRIAPHARSRVAGGGATTSRPGDVAPAIDGYRSVYEHLTTERPGP